MNAKKIIYTLFLVYFIVSITCGAILSYRLGQTRRQLDNVRVELTAAQNRQYELATILRRDSEILSESSTTIAGIRSQIRVIRESYEEMEKLLYSGFLNSN